MLAGGTSEAGPNGLAFCLLSTTGGHSEGSAAGSAVVIGRSATGGAGGNASAGKMSMTPTGIPTDLEREAERLRRLSAEIRQLLDEGRLHEAHRLNDEARVLARRVWRL